MGKEPKNIFFVSGIKTPDSNSTSTHLMTETLLRGWKENGYKVTFFAICEYENEAENIKKYYSQFTEKVIALKSLYLFPTGKFTNMLNILNAAFFDRKYSKAIYNMLPLGEHPDLILSHAPSFEAIPFCKALKKKFKNVPFYQYWSDPVALSGIVPETFGYKRWIFYIAEKRAFKNADQIIFGTKTLLDMNSWLYKKYTKKMRYVDVAYLHKEKKSIFTRNNFEYIYAGNYFSSIRNIIPLYNAFNDLGGEYKLYIYGASDLDLRSTNNVIVNERIPAKELEKIEASFINNISLLNHSCMQIPGKTFYQTDTDQNIIVIADGSHKEDIIDYLKTYNRFEICQNDEKNIIDKIIKTSETKEFYCSEEAKKAFSPKSISADIVEGRLILDKEGVRCV